MADCTVLMLRPKSQRADRPVQVVLAGPPCSGKSTIGAWLARNLHGIHLEVDALLTAILPGSNRCLEDRLLAYEIAAVSARTILRRGSMPILDCTYSRRETRQQLVDNVQPNIRLIVVEFLVNPDVAVTRFNHRPAHHATDMTPEIVRLRTESYPYGSGAVLVDSESNPEDIQASVIQAIESGGQDFDGHRWVRSGL
jgi:predicted kinase